MDKLYKVIKANTDKSFIREVLAPGFGSDDLTAKVDPDNRTLTVVGTAKPCPFYDKDGLIDKFGLNKLKKQLGDFSVTLDIPAKDSRGRTIDMDDVIVDYYAGMLRVNFNKVPVDNSRVIF